MVQYFRLLIHYLTFFPYYYLVMSTNNGITSSQSKYISSANSTSSNVTPMTSFNVNVNVFSTSNVSSQSTNANVTNIISRRQKKAEQDQQRLLLSLQKSTSSKSNESCIDGDETESDPEVK